MKTSFRGIFRCVKGALIRSFSSPYFHAFRLNTERYGVTLRIQFECGKIRTRKTPNMDAFHVCLVTCQASMMERFTKIVGSSKLENKAQFYDMLRYKTQQKTVRFSRVF